MLISKLQKFIECSIKKRQVYYVTSKQNFYYSAGFYIKFVLKML